MPSLRQVPEQTSVESSLRVCVELPGCSGGLSLQPCADTNWTATAASHLSRTLLDWILLVGFLKCTGVPIGRV